MKQKKIASRSSWAQNIAFVSTDKRFRDSVGDLDIPPSTAYYPKVGLADNLQKTNARSGAFGSSDERFKVKKESSVLPREKLTEQELNRELQEYLHKNGDRSTKSPTGGGVVRKYTSAFAPSPESRLRPIKSPPGPPPGAYEVTPKWIKERGVPVMAPDLKISRKRPEYLPG